MIEVRDVVECENKLRNKRRVVRVIGVLVNAKKLSLDCTRVLHKSMLISTLMYERRREKDVEDESGTDR